MYYPFTTAKITIHTKKNKIYQTFAELFSLFSSTEMNATKKILQCTPREFSLIKVNELINDESSLLNALKNDENIRIFLSVRRKREYFEGSQDFLTVKTLGEKFAATKNKRISF